MLLNSLVLPNGIWQMQLFQINQSEDSSKITIMYDNPSGQLHQRSITWAFNYMSVQLQPHLLYRMLMVDTEQSGHTERRGV